MGKIVTFADLLYRETATGVTRAAITGAETKEISAAVIRLGPGARLRESVPAGAEGDGVSFLEVHVPAGFTTVRG
ncbi:MAG: hypothetical protein ACRDFR_02960 [Candidatus Limnocylindria bacterium]